jgi:hypothetical protein
MSKIGSFITCCICYALTGRWRATCAHAYEHRDICPRWRTFVRIMGEAHCYRSWRYWSEP